MTLDQEEDRTILLQLLDQAAFPGKFAETVVRLKASVRNATVEAKDAGPSDRPRLD